MLDFFPSFSDHTKPIRTMYKQTLTIALPSLVLEASPKEPIPAARF